MKCDCKYFILCYHYTIYTITFYLLVLLPFLLHFAHSASSSPIHTQGPVCHCLHIPPRLLPYTHKVRSVIVCTFRLVFSHTHTRSGLSLSAHSAWSSPIHTQGPVCHCLHIPPRLLPYTHKVRSVIVCTFRLVFSHTHTRSGLSLSAHSAWSSPIHTQGPVCHCLHIPPRLLPYTHKVRSVIVCTFRLVFSHTHTRSGLSLSAHSASSSPVHTQGPVCHCLHIPPRLLPYTHKVRSVIVCTFRLVFSHTHTRSGLSLSAHSAWSSPIHTQGPVCHCLHIPPRLLPYTHKVRSVMESLIPLRCSCSSVIFTFNFLPMT